MISRCTCSIPGAPGAFQAHLQHSRCTCSIPKEAVFPRLLYCYSRCSQTRHRHIHNCSRRSQTCHQRSQTCRQHSQVHPNLSPAHQGVLKLITITPIVLLYQSSEISVTPKAGRIALLQSATLLKLTHLSLPSTSSQTLLDASKD